MVFWELAGAGASLAGGLLANKKAGEMASLARKRHKTLYARQQEMIRRTFGSAERLQRDSLTELKRGADVGRRELSKRESSAKREARDLGLRDQAAAESSAGARGLTNTSYLDSAKRAATSDTQRRLADVDAAFGSQFANLAYTESADRAQQYGNLANLQLAKYGAEQQLEDLNYGFWVGGGGSQYAGSGGGSGLDLGGLASAFSSAFSGFGSSGGGSYANPDPYTTSYGGSGSGEY